MKVVPPRQSPDAASHISRSLDTQKDRRRLGDCPSSSCDGWLGSSLTVDGVSEQLWDMTRDRSLDRVLDAALDQWKPRLQRLILLFDEGGDDRDGGALRLEVEGSPQRKQAVDWLAPQTPLGPGECGRPLATPECGSSISAKNTQTVAGMPGWSSWLM